jgi:hypothetical protein
MFLLLLFMVLFTLIWFCFLTIFGIYLRFLVDLDLLFLYIFSYWNSLHVNIHLFFPTLFFSINIFMLRIYCALAELHCIAVPQTPPLMGLINTRLVWHLPNEIDYFHSWLHLSKKPLHFLLSKCSIHTQSEKKKKTIIHKKWENIL